MSCPKKTRITVIEPSPVIREGLRALLENSSEFRVESAYSDLQAFQESRQEPSPEILLLNPAAINPYRRFNVRTLFPEHPDTMVVALLYGYADPETLASFDAAIDIYNDGPKLSNRLRGFIQTFSTQQHGSTTESIDLSDREKEILVSVATGRTNKEIADRHFISIHTVISHRKNITRKTGIKTVSGLTIYAMFNNLISQEDLQ